MKHNRYTSIGLPMALIITDGLFYGLTRPVYVAPGLVLIGFCLLVLTAYSLINNMQKLLAVYAPWLSRQKKLSFFLTAGTTTLIALQSIGQLTVRDSVLIPLVAVVVYAYFGYSKRAITSSYDVK